MSTLDKYEYKVRADEIKALIAEGEYAEAVKIADTIRGFKEIIEGKHDDIPEQAFYMVGTIDEVVEKAKTIEE